MVSKVDIIIYIFFGIRFGEDEGCRYPSVDRTLSVYNPPICIIIIHMISHNLFSFICTHNRKENFVVFTTKLKYWKSN